MPSIYSISEFYFVVVASLGKSFSHCMGEDGSGDLRRRRISAEIVVAQSLGNSG